MSNDYEEYFNPVLYQDIAYYPNEALDPVVISFLNGDPAPMIAEVNQENYNCLSLGIYSTFSPQGHDPELLNQYVYSNVELITHVSSVTDFDLTLNIDSQQAAQIANALVSSNVELFSLKSDSLTSEGMPEFMSAIAASKIEYLCIDGKLSNDVISVMNFQGFTHLETVIFFHCGLREEAYPIIFENLSDSSVKDIAIYAGYSDSLPAISFSNINLADTNISRIELTGFKFAENAFENLSFKSSQVDFLWLSSSHFSKNNLAAFSESLKDSQVSTLWLGLKEIEEGDLAYLDLRGTQVEELSIHNYSFSFGSYTAYDLKNDLSYLDLSGTNVKTLSLRSNQIGDQDILLLNLENTSIEHLILDSNPITLDGVELIKDMIKGTHVIDVSFGDYEYDTNHNYMGYNRFLLVNDCVLDENQSEVILLSDVMSDSQFSDVLQPEQIGLSDAIVSSQLFEQSLIDVPDESIFISSGASLEQYFVENSSNPAFL